MIFISSLDQVSLSRTVKGWTILEELLITRRAILKTLALATAIFPFANNVRAKKLDQSPFSLGIASGSPTDTSIVLWTRLYDAGVFGSNIPNEPINVGWEIAEDKAFLRVVKSGSSMALPALAHSVHAEVSGLPSNKWFFYRFQCGGFTSAIGKTRTLPSPNQSVDKLRLAYASCQNYEHGYFSAYSHMKNEGLDLVMFLGDYIYEYPSGKAGVRSVDGSWALDLESYRKRYALYKADEDLQSMHAECPWIMTWDDHEVQNDYAGNNPGTKGPAVDSFSKRRAAAYQAYYEHMPLPASVLVQGIDGLLAGSEMRIYGNFQFGKLANIFMLDDRQYRDADICTPAGAGSAIFDPKSCPELTNPNRTLLGPQQEQWLASALRDSGKSNWSVIGQPTLYAQRYLGAGDQKRIWNDGWDGFPVARKKIDQLLIQYKVKNFVIFGGDVHQNLVGYIKEDYDNPNSATLGVEFCGTSITANFGGGGNLQQTLKNNPHFIFADASRRGYGVAEFTPHEMTVTLRTVMDAKQKESSIESLAKFRVMSRSNKIDRLS